MQPQPGNYDNQKQGYPVQSTYPAYGTTPSGQGAAYPPPAPPPPYTASSQNQGYYEGQGNGATDEAIDDDGPFTSSSFNTRQIRHAFIRKVYLIMTAQLCVTLAFVAVFQFVNPVKKWVRHHIWFYYIAFIVFIVVYLVLICCDKVRRKYPNNFIALAIFTLAFSYMTAAITSFHNTFSVLYALVITVVLCGGLTIFAMQTKIDFTMCSGILFVFSLVFLLFGFSVAIMYFFVDHNTARILHIVYGALGALLFSLFLVFDTQMIMGGRKHDLNPEEYIVAALQLYLDVVMIFLFILSIFGGGGGRD
jgi:protein lifeguard